MSTNNRPIAPPIASPAINDVILDAPGNNLSDLEAQLKQIQLKRLLREEAQLAEIEDSQRKSRDAGIATIKMQMAKQINDQAACSHLKPNGYTQLAGQKDHSGKLRLVCQRCQKAFTDDTTPSNLMPNPEWIGGPHNV